MVIPTVVLVSDNDSTITEEALTRQDNFMYSKMDDYA